MTRRVALTAWALTAAIVIACVAALMVVDLQASSTAGFALITFPLVSLVAILFVWLGALVFSAIQRQRFANRNAKPS
jgi:hypothetical protein